MSGPSEGAVARGRGRDDPGRPRLRRRQIVPVPGEPGLLHACGLYANDRPDLAAGGGDFRIAQLARPSALADPIGGQAGFPIGRSHMDVAAKADDISKADATCALSILGSAACDLARPAKRRRNLSFRTTRSYAA